jgi:Fe-S-cluster containining protein
MMKHSELDALNGACRRCGTCCEKGGPALHTADKDLVESGRIPLKYLYTLRPGERIRDNVKGGLIRGAADIIKIKGQKTTWCCVFYDTAKKACRIYPDRPLECRVLNCQKPEALQSLYERDRLSRKCLLSSMEGLWDLVETHEKRCALDAVSGLLRRCSNNPHGGARKDLHIIVQYDAQLRRLVVEKGKLDPEILDFLFGRPLSVIVPLLEEPVPR